LEFLKQLLCNHGNVHLLQISDRKEGTVWTRKDVTLLEAEQQVICKVWNDDAVDDLAIGDYLQLTNVEVDIYEGRTTINSTDLTDVQV